MIRSSRSILPALVAALIALVAGLAQPARGADPAPPKRIYLAPDDHTDYSWTLDDEGCRRAFLEMLDYYLAQIDATAANPSPHQARWNCDGSFWLRIDYLAIPVPTMPLFDAGKTHQHGI